MYQFGQVFLKGSEVFMKTTLSMAYATQMFIKESSFSVNSFVNLKPIAPGRTCWT